MLSSKDEKLERDFGKLLRLHPSVKASNLQQTKLFSIFKITSYARDMQRLIDFYSMMSAVEGSNPGASNSSK